MIKIIGYIIFLVLMASCTTFNAPIDYGLDAHSKNGLAVFSFTSEGILDNYYLQYRNSQEESTGDITLWTNKNPLDWDAKKKGRLVTLDLPAGEYELFRLIAPLDVSSENNFSIPFEVSAGKVKYFGNVHVVIPDRNQFIIKVIDESSRDLETFFSRYKNISQDELNSKISTLN